MTYLLPCECGRQLPVEVSQAGQSLHCECGRQVEAPTMRGLRQLKPAPQSKPQAPRASQRRGWGRGQGIAFAGGLLLTALGAIAAAFFAFDRAQIKAAQPSMDEHFREVATMFDEMPVDDLWETWHTVRENGLGPQTPTYNALAQRAAARLLTFTWIAVAVAAVGLVLSVSAVLFGRRAS